MRINLLINRFGSPIEKQIAFWDSIRLSRYDVRKQHEDKDDLGLRGEPTVVASDDPLHSDPLSLAIVDAKSVFDASLQLNRQLVRMTGQLWRSQSSKIH